MQGLYALYIRTHFMLHIPRQCITMQGLHVLYAFYASYTRAMYYNARLVCLICILCFISPGDVLQCKVCMLYMHFMLHIPRRCITMQGLHALYAFYASYTQAMYYNQGLYALYAFYVSYTRAMYYNQGLYAIKYASYAQAMYYQICYILSDCTEAAGFIRGEWKRNIPNILGNVCRGNVLNKKSHQKVGKGTGAGECIPLPPPPAHPVKTIFAAGINVHNNVKLMTIMLNNTRKKGLLAQKS